MIVTLDIKYMLIFVFLVENIFYVIVALRSTFSLTLHIYTQKYETYLLIDYLEK